MTNLRGTSALPVRPGAALLASLVLCALAACASSRPDAARYVGVLTHPLPPGVEDLQGAMVGFPDDTLHAVAHVRAEGREMLWFQRLVERTPEGRAVFRVLAAQPLPELRPDEAVVIALCRLDGADDPYVAAVVEAEPDREVWTGVRAAWRADGARGRFVPVDPSRVACLNEGYGV